MNFLLCKLLNNYKLNFNLNFNINFIGAQSLAQQTCITGKGRWVEHEYYRSKRGLGIFTIAKQHMTDNGCYTNGLVYLSNCSTATGVYPTDC